MQASVPLQTILPTREHAHNSQIAFIWEIGDVLFVNLVHQEYRCRLIALIFVYLTNADFRKISGHFAHSN